MQSNATKNKMMEMTMKHNKTVASEAYRAASKQETTRSVNVITLSAYHQE
jgi:hypothetical protein